MMEPTFTMMVGLPGSGKSTLAAQMEGDFTYLSTDALIEAHAASRGLTYSAVWKDYIAEATATMWSDFHAAVKQERDIVWDQTNLSVKKRRGVMTQLPKSYRKFCWVATANPETIEQRRVSRDGKIIPASVIETMRQSFVEPTVEEGFELIRWVDTSERAAA